MAKNPALYRTLSIPHETREAANDALAKFFAAVEAARIEHRVPDVTVIVAVRTKDGEEEYDLATRAHYGDSLRELVMIADAYGHAKAEHEALIAKLITKRPR